MKHRALGALLFCLTLAAACPQSVTQSDAAADRQALPDASAEKLPRWRGFNLLEKFSKDWSNGPFAKEDFELIAALGFNFVRLPMDYRVWIENGDWEQLNEAALAEIDQAVAWGRKYGVHVCLNFHRAPGYCVNPPKEPRNLWTDPKVQRICARHWAAFAERYQGIPGRELSFNLFNEPAGIDGPIYAKVVRMMVEAIHAEDPDRPIIADGLEWGTKPVEELVPLRVAQSTRGYQPFWLTHYRADWVEGAEDWRPPQWPLPRLNAFLYGSAKPDLTRPLVLAVEGGLQEESLLRLRVNVVSASVELLVKADGVTVLAKKLVSGPGKGEWKKAVYKQEWGIYQNIFDRDYLARIPAKTKRVELVIGEGDWLTFSEIGLRPSGAAASAETVLRPSDEEWGVKQGTIYLDGSGHLVPDKTPSFGQAWLWEQWVAPWKALQTQGVGVMVGEWGAYNKTPHDVTLRWMRDCLDNWRQAGWGWALWNFRGAFGILDSERSDVVYEDFKGHKLDREMLEVLQRY